MDFIHQCAFEKLAKVQSQYPIEDLQAQIQFLCGSINLLQSHCQHLQTEIETLKQQRSSS